MLSPYVDALTIVPDSNDLNLVEVIASQNYHTSKYIWDIRKAELTKLILDLNLNFEKKAELMKSIDNYSEKSS